MRIRKGLSTAVVSLGVYLFASHVHAIAFTDASILGSTDAFTSPSAIQSGKGKPKKEHINGLSGIFAGEPWSLLDRSNKSSVPFNDALYLLSADVRKRSGAWELTSDKPYFSPDMDFILLLKSGKHWGAYLFQSADIGPGLQRLGGKFEISWVNKKGRKPKLRYASVYGRLAAAPTDFSDTPELVIDAPRGPSDTPSVETDTSLVDPDVAADVDDSPPGSTSISPDGTDTQAIEDPNAIPVPGSLSLVVMGLGLAIRQLRRKTSDNTEGNQQG